MLTELYKNCIPELRKYWKNIKPTQKNTKKNMFWKG